MQYNTILKVLLLIQELEDMLELAVAAGTSPELEVPTLSHFYAVAMNALENGTSAISAGIYTSSVFKHHITGMTMHQFSLYVNTVCH